MRSRATNPVETVRGLRAPASLARFYSEFRRRVLRLVSAVRRRWRSGGDATQTFGCWTVRGFGAHCGFEIHIRDIRFVDQADDATVRIDHGQFTKAAHNHAFGGRP